MLGWCFCPPHAATTSRKGICYYPGWSASHPAPCSCPRKAAWDGLSPWIPALTREIQKKLLLPSLRLAHPWLLQTFGERAGIQKSLCLSSLFKIYLSNQNKSFCFKCWMGLEQGETGFRQCATSDETFYKS